MGVGGDKFWGYWVKERFAPALLALSFLVPPELASASKPLSQRSQEACESYLASSLRQSPATFSSSTLVTLGTLLRSARAPYLAVLARTGDMYAREFPSPGLVHMYYTAEVAADEIIDRENIAAVAPSGDIRDPLAAHAATMALIESKDPPEFIRDAVIIRDGVVVVIPILQRIAKRSRATGKAMYVPLITKGHQELSLDDKLAAAFAAWALEHWLGQLPNKALIYLRPMAEVRTSRRRQSPEVRSVFVVDPRDYMAQVHSIYENFMRIAANEEGALETTAPYRNQAAVQSPWGAHLKDLLDELSHLSMVPNPPSQKQIEALAAAGYDSLDKLARLNINSPEFLRVSVLSEIEPVTLRRFVGRAVSRKLDRVLVTEPYSNPFANVKRLVHIDFEDILHQNIKSGVYLFGIEIQGLTPALSRKPFIKKHQILAETLTQAGVDDAWAEFLRFLKRDPELRDGSFLIPTYSKHENVKFEQEFDILKAPASEFTAAQRRSPFYSEIEVPAGLDKNGDPKVRAIGRLIRNEAFFKNYTDLKPSDVFTFMDKTFDLLAVVRKNLVFPAYTNSIKKTLDYAGTAGDEVIYPPGSNGLESMAWALQYYQTGEAEIRTKMQAYNERDIDGNRLMANVIIEHSGKAIDAKLRWNRAMSENLTAASDAVAAKKWVSALYEKRTLLATIMGREVNTLAPRQIDELTRMLDRTEYLQDLRDSAENSSPNDDDRLRAQRQILKFEMESKRQHRLFEFFSNMNPAMTRNPRGEASMAFAKLMMAPTNYLVPKHIHLIVALDYLEDEMARISRRLRLPRSLAERLVLPARLEDAFESIEFESISLDEPRYTSGDLHKIWHGLYLTQVFSNE